MIERIPNLVLACLSQVSTTDFRYLPSRFSSPSGSSSAGKLLLNYPTEHSRPPCRSARSLHPAEHGYVALLTGPWRARGLSLIYRAHVSRLRASNRILGYFLASRIQSAINWRHTTIRAADGQPAEGTLHSAHSPPKKDGEPWQPV